MLVIVNVLLYVRRPAVHQRTQLMTVRVVFLTIMISMILQVICQICEICGNFANLPIGKIKAQPFVLGIPPTLVRWQVYGNSEFANLAQKRPNHFLGCFLNPSLASLWKFGRACFLAGIRVIKWLPVFANLGKVSLLYRLERLLTNTHRRAFLGRGRHAFSYGQPSLSLHHCGYCPGAHDRRAFSLFPPLLLTRVPTPPNLIQTCLSIRRTKPSSRGCREEVIWGFQSRRGGGVRSVH